MLSEQQIKELAIKTQTSLLNVAREYVQNLFLHYFYLQEKSESVLFKGGTALRIVYRSPRFSEDLDFSAPNIHKQTIENLLEGTFLKLEAEGLKIDIEESKMTSGGFLAIISVKLISHAFTISFELSSRKKTPKGEIVLIENPYISSYTIVSLKKEELISEKIEALLNRQKPRDFFDLYFMLRANLIPEKNILKRILPIVEKTKIGFKNELSQFLPQRF